MHHFKCWLSGLLMVSASYPAHAQFRKVTPKEFQIYLAKKFVQDRVAEFNALRKIKGADVLYELILPKRLRESFKSQWKNRPTMKAEGTTLVIQIKNQPTVRMEVVDLLRQKYKINGRPFTRAWYGNQFTDAELLTKLIYQKRGYSLQDFVMPKSEAQLVIGGVALYALITGLEATAEVAGTAAVVDAVGAGAVGAGVGTAGGMAAESAATSAATKEAALGMKAMARAALKEIQSDPELRAELTKLLLGDALKGGATAAETPAKSAAVSVLGRFATWIAALSGTVAVSSSIGNTLSYANSKDANFWAAFFCEFSVHSISLDNCLAAQRVKPKPIGDAAVAMRTHYNLCYNERDGEIQGSLDEKGGQKEIFVTRYDDKLNPVSGLRFILDSSGNVEDDSIRQYTLKSVPDGASQVLRFMSEKQLAVKEGAQLKESDVFPKPLDADVSKANVIIDDMAKKIAARDRIIKENTTPLNSTFEPGELVQFQRDKKAIDSEDEHKRDEFAIINRFKIAEAQLRGQCQGVADATADPKTVEAASVPGGDTATAIKDSADH